MGRLVNRRSELKRTPLTRARTPLRRSPLNPVSPKRRRQNREYHQLRAEFLAAHPWCQSPADCGQRATEIQHRRGRRGARLLDVDWFAASCHDCNQRAETDTAWALVTGWLVRIEGSEAA